MMHKSGRNDTKTPGASVKQERYLRDYITRKQEEELRFAPVPPELEKRHLTFDEWWDLFKHKVGKWDHDTARAMCLETWKAAQENM